jgi:hypothetical protein
MGILFVAFLWLVALCILGTPVAIALGLWSRKNQKRSSLKSNNFRRPGIAAALPLILIAYGGFAAIGYGIWCEAVRNVDMGIGDGCQVPVGNNHFFCMIDVPDKGYLLKNGCSGSPRIDDITELAKVGDQIVGISKSSGPFIFNTRSAALQKFNSLDMALSRFTPRPALQTANVFYLHRRWGWSDLIAVLIAAIPCIGILIVWYKRFIRMPIDPR